MNAAQNAHKRHKDYYSKCCSICLKQMKEEGIMVETLRNQKKTDIGEWYLLGSVILMIVLVIVIIVLLVKDANALPLVIQNCTAYGCI